MKSVLAALVYALMISFAFANDDKSAASSPPDYPELSVSQLENLLSNSVTKTDVEEVLGRCKMFYMIDGKSVTWIYHIRIAPDRRSEFLSSRRLPEAEVYRLLFDVSVTDIIEHSGIIAAPQQLLK